VKILIADDDPQILRALRITLAARGYEVVTAHDGKAALDAATSTHPDIIVLDLGMPGLTGVQVIEAVRGWSQVPILVVLCVLWGLLGVTTAATRPYLAGKVRQTITVYEVTR